MRFEYVGGVLPEERDLVERFEADVLPYIERMGGYIGESAMHGDGDAEQAIRSYRLFVEGLPELRPQNYLVLVGALKRWEQKRVN